MFLVASLLHTSLHCCSFSECSLAFLLLVSCCAWHPSALPPLHVVPLALCCWAHCLCWVCAPVRQMLLLLTFLCCLRWCSHSLALLLNGCLSALAFDNTTSYSDTPAHASLHSCSFLLAVGFLSLLASLSSRPVTVLLVHLCLRPTPRYSAFLWFFCAFGLSGGRDVLFFARRVRGCGPDMCGVAASLLMFVRLLLPCSTFAWALFSGSTLPCSWLPAGLCLRTALLAARSHG